MGRTRGAYQHKLTDDDLKKIESMAGLGLSMEKICLIMGIGKRTIERQMKRSKKINDAILKGRAKSELQTRKCAHTEAWKGNISMLIFLLKTRYGFRETDVIEVKDLERMVKEDIEFE